MIAARAHLLPRLLGYLALVVFAVGYATSVLAQSADDNPVVIDADGTVHVPPLTVPPSSYLSPEGKAYLAQHLKDMQNPASKQLPEGDVPFFMKGYMASAKAQFHFDMKKTGIAGVGALVYTPSGGIKPENKNRVLINLHGGGFAGCFPGCAELESMPVASLGGYKVVSLDYREGPDYEFPAASEDVAKVYRELLKTYPAKNIGIYGCSAGGMLVGMSLAWFQKEGLPAPGAAGVFCAGLTLGDVAFGGDANYVVAPIGEAHMPAEPPPPLGKGLPPLGYLAHADHNDPLVAPGTSLAVLAKFPPTLFITATRGFELSSAVYSHGRMIKAGAEAELHVWDGLFHGFFYNPDVPESRDAYNVMINFFDKHLSK